MMGPGQNTLANLKAEALILQGDLLAERQVQAESLERIQEIHLAIERLAEKVTGLEREEELERTKGAEHAPE